MINLMIACEIMSIFGLIGILLLVIIGALILKLGFKFIMLIINFLFNNIIWVLIVLFILGILIF